MSLVIDTLTDGHIHTSLCKHATGEMEEYVQAAIEKGLERIFFLEHMEEGVNYSRTTWLTEQDFDLYFAEGQRLQRKYADSLAIGIGVEVGYSPKHRHTLLSRLNGRQWDRIGISYHYLCVDDYEYDLNLVSSSDERAAKLSEEQLKGVEQKYYARLIEAVEFLPGNILCHLDAILRFHPLRNQVEPPWDLIDKLLEAVYLKEMALEINTSGIPLRGEAFPIRNIWQKALNKGIKLVAGSDAHKPEDVGRNFADLAQMLSS